MHLFAASCLPTHHTRVDCLKLDVEIVVSRPSAPTPSLQKNPYRLRPLCSWRLRIGLEGSWTMTARGLDHQFRGKADFPISEVTDLATAAQAIYADEPERIAAPLEALD